MYTTLWNLIQQRQIGELQKESGKSMRQTSRSQTDHRTLEDRHEHLALVCEAMWEILRDRHGISEHELMNKVEEIDIRDGVRDGKSKKVKRCSGCTRPFNAKHERCIFCGNEEYVESAWEKVS